MSDDIRDMFTYNSSTYAHYQAITGNAASNSYIDLGVNAKKMFSGKKPVYLVVRVGTAFAKLTSLGIALESDTSSGFGAVLKQVLNMTIAKAGLTAGACVVCQILPNQNWQRYLRLYFTNNGTAEDAGTVYAYLTDQPENIDAQIDVA